MVKYAVHEPKLEVTPLVIKSKLLERSWIDVKQLESSINKINSIIMPFKERLARNERHMYLYLLGGLALILSLAILLGILVHFALSILLICSYLGGMIYIIRRYQKENNQLLKSIHFNTCLVIRNENERYYSRYNLKARVGFLS